MAEKFAMIEVVRGSHGGVSLCVSDERGSGTRVAGGKPWGGGTTIHKFKVNVADVVHELRSNGWLEEEKS